MPKFTNEDVRALMDKPSQVRNVGLIGAMATGKTSLMDCLGALSGLLAEEKIGEARFTHCRKDEQEKGCTLKTNVTSLVMGPHKFDEKAGEQKILLSMVDTPGHAEYSAELSVALPLVDGAIMMVDGSGGGLAAQTSRHLKDLNLWQVRPVVFVNRLDVSINVLEKKAPEIYDDLSQVADALNTAIASIEPPYEGAQVFKVSPEDGSVMFGSASNGWAFTLPQVAGIYAKKFGIEVDKMASRLWGEMYFNAKKKLWTNQAGDGAVRAFDQFVMDPILKVKSVCMAGDFTKLEKMLGALGVALTNDDKKHEGKLLFRRVMQLWMPAGNCITSAVVKHVPNPLVAGKARANALTLGAATDPNTQCVIKCDPKGQILIACAKLAPQPSTPGRFYALGRVFSGTVGADKIYLLPDDHVPEYAKEAEDEPMPAAEEEAADPEATPGSPAGKKNKPKEAAKSNMEERRLQGVFICQAKAFNSIPNIPAGNIGAFSGVDQYMAKRNTMSANKDAFPLKPPSFNVSAVVKVSVSPKEAKELPKTVEGLRRLAKSCPLVEVQMEEGGDHVVGACGGEHIRLLRKDLETDYLPGIKLEWGAPSVSYKETVTMESSMMCLSKSPNKHNRLFMKAEPLDEEVCRAIESKKITPMQDAKTRGKILANEYGWDKNDTLKIWGFGPAAESADKPVGANILVDQTKGIQYLGEIKESVNSGLLWAAKQGPIAEESMRGIRFNLLDVKLHTDSIHRGMGQIQPTARRVFFASMMTAGMRLVEPVFLASIEAPSEASAGIMQALGACRGELVLSDDQGGTLSVTAYVPISETIGNTPFATVLSQKTNGKAFVSYAFDHWSTMPADPMTAGSKSYELMIDIRKRKGLKPEPPVFADYYDKL